VTVRGKGSGPRQLKVRARGGKNRSQSSKLWLERQLNDPYVARAKREGMRSRAAYKLIEIDDRAHFLRKGARVIDLGAAPGGWSQVAAKRIDAPKQGRVVAIDILPMDPVPGVDFVGLDFLDETAPAKLKDMIGGPADVVLSDMAPNLSGIESADAARITHLVELAIEFARAHLVAEGALVCKLFHGSGYSQLVKRFKDEFRTVKPIKPGASRTKSAETFVVGMGLKRRASGSDIHA